MNTASSAVGEPTPQQSKQPRKFGVLKTAPVQPAPKPWLPPELRKGVFTTNLPHDEAAAKYGIHKIRITRGTSIAGQTVTPGDEADVTGDVVVLLVSQGMAESLDPRRNDEARILAEARRLSIPLADSENPAFQPAAPHPQPRRRSFVLDRTSNE
jgi:hypothetical protein